MFVVGIALGPAFGLLIGDQAARSRFLGPGRTLLLVALLLLVLLFVGFLDLELRLGLIAGILLGLLLSYTPPGVSTPDGAA